MKPVVPAESPPLLTTKVLEKHGCRVLPRVVDSADLRFQCAPGDANAAAPETTRSQRKALARPQGVGLPGHALGHWLPCWTGAAPGPLLLLLLCLECCSLQSTCCSGLYSEVSSQAAPSRLTSPLLPYAHFSHPLCFVILLCTLRL